MVEGSEGDAGSDAEVPGAGGDMRRHHVHGGADAVAREVVLGEPDGVIAGPVHDLDSSERPLVDVLERHAAVTPAEELQDADLHGWRGAWIESR
jgi:hypothetical protein